jgi:DNA-directed RNA polymerase subunit RPC12/RpoP
MTIKRFEETKIKHIVMGEAKDEFGRCVFQCSACKHIFDYQDVLNTDTEPTYCPHCGRRNSDA